MTCLLCDSTLTDSAVCPACEAAMTFQRLLAEPPSAMGPVERVERLSRILYEAPRRMATVLGGTVSHPPETEGT